MTLLFLHFIDQLILKFATINIYLASTLIGGSFKVGLCLKNKPYIHFSYKHMCVYSQELK